MVIAIDSHIIIIIQEAVEAQSCFSPVKRRPLLAVAVAGEEEAEGQVVIRAESFSLSRT